MRLIHRAFFLATLAVMAGSGLREARAGVFNIPEFVAPGQQTFGFEPELSFDRGAGAAISGRYTLGLNDLNNVQAILGTGGGPRRFRVGGNLTFDLFPDVEGQPGIGIAAQALFARLPDYGRLELTGVPYLHKLFANRGNPVDPFVSFPFGFGFSSVETEVLASIVVGALFHATESMRYTVELGVAVSNTDTYISTGVVFAL